MTTTSIRSFCINQASLGVYIHGKAVDAAAADRFTDKKDLEGGGEFSIRAAHGFPVKGDGWEEKGSKEIKAMQRALPTSACKMSTSSSNQPLLAGRTGTGGADSPADTHSGLRKFRQDRGVFLWERWSPLQRASPGFCHPQSAQITHKQGVGVPSFFNRQKERNSA